MFTTFKRRIAKPEDVRKKAGPKGLNDFLAEVQDYSRRTRVILEEALSKFLPDLTADDLRASWPSWSPPPVPAASSVGISRNSNDRIITSAGSTRKETWSPAPSVNEKDSIGSAPVEG